MRRHVYLVMNVVFWLIMVVGFADNCLFDVGQASNAATKVTMH